MGVGRKATIELQECILLQYRQRSDVLPVQQRFRSFEPGDGASVFAGAGPVAARQELLQQPYLPLLHFRQGGQDGQWGIPHGCFHDNHPEMHSGEGLEHVPSLPLSVQALQRCK